MTSGNHDRTDLEELMHKIPTVMLGMAVLTHGNAGICPIASKVRHVTLATPPFGVIHHPLYTTSSIGSNRENTKSLASAV